MEPKDRIIVALDVPDLEKARPLIAALAPHVGMFKVGLELITAVGGPAVIAAVRAAGGKVMYDGKFCDIPNTVEGAAKAVAVQGVEMFTMHASSGKEAIRAAVRSAGTAKVIGVTVLTSIEEGECWEIFGRAPQQAVDAFAANLVDMGAQAVVCSPREVEALKGLPLLRITPGVRPAWSDPGDQRRFTTPAQAVKAGADMLVVGRPITKPTGLAKDPVDAARRIAAEIGEALA